MQSGISVLKRHLAQAHERGWPADVASSRTFVDRLASTTTDLFDTLFSGEERNSGRLLIDEEIAPAVKGDGRHLISLSLEGAAALANIMVNSRPYLLTGYSFKFRLHIFKTMALTSCYYA